MGIAGKVIAWLALIAKTLPVADVARYKASCALVATTLMSPLPAVTVSLDPLTICPGPLEIA